MKKLSKLLLLLSVIFISAQLADASNLQIEKISQPIKIPNKISQPITISFAANGHWRLLAEPLDSLIRNVNNPNFTLPVTRLEVAQMGGIPLAHLDTGRACEVLSGNDVGLKNLNLALNVINFDTDYPGSYISDIKFTVVNDDSTVAEDIYTLRFNQDTIATIDFSNRNPFLQLSKENILKKNGTQSLETPFSVYICSNKDWKLYLKGVPTDTNKDIRYFFKVMGASDNTITTNQTAEFIPMQDNQIFVASGKSTINTATNTLDKKAININYQVKGPEDRFIPAGTKTEEFEYRLETED
jgi:hypothetical protein